MGNDQANNVRSPPLVNPMTLRRQSPKQSARAERSAAAKRTLLAVSDACNWCGRRSGVDLEHVAGRIGDLIDDERFLLLLCRSCHQTAEERVLGADGVALKLALLRFAGRGSVSEYWSVTGRKYPDAELVEDWSRRLVNPRRSE
jgi:hypothetical protein